MDAKLVRHCAPTLCGLKPGSLFRCCHGAGGYAREGRSDCTRSGKYPCLRKALAQDRKKLEPFGLQICVLVADPQGDLVYVYDKYLLTRMLAEPQTGAFLANLGYDAGDLNACISLLCKRTREAFRQKGASKVAAFPNEIGLFLGYPIEDVEGFIRERGQNCLACGCWKVYANVERALEQFRVFKECTAAMQVRFEGGESLGQMVLEARGCAVSNEKQQMRTLLTA